MVGAAAAAPDDAAPPAGGRFGVEPPDADAAPLAVGGLLALFVDCDMADASMLANDETMSPPPAAPAAPLPPAVAPAALPPLLLRPPTLELEPPNSGV